MTGPWHIRIADLLAKILEKPVTAIAGVVAALFLVSCSKQSEQSQKIEDYLEKQYGALGKTTEEILSHEAATNRFTVLGALEWRISQKADARGDNSLTDTERRLLAAAQVDGEVKNGGFNQYFFNSSGDNADVALAGLNDIGAIGAAGLLERAMAVFPGRKWPKAVSARRDLMEQIASQSKSVWDKCDHEFYMLKEDVNDLLLGYAKKKKSDIVLP